VAGAGKTSGDGPGGERLFLGVALPEEVRRALEGRLREALGGEPFPGRAVPPGSWHLTLRFLGDTPREARERLVGELRAAPLGEAFPLELAGLGAFPRPARASVLWAGVGEGEAALRALAAKVEGAVQRAGFPAEPRPFSPHLTLSRIQPPRDVRALLERATPLTERFTVDAVVLFRSHLGRGPARYEAVERFPLDPRA
jgi:2'-5' RNA ligase